MRLLLAGLVLALPACGVHQRAPDTAALASPAAPSEVAPPAPATAAPTARSAGAGDAALAPPDMAMRWTLQVPSVDGRPWTRQSFEIKADGSATWESATGGGDGDVKEDLTEEPSAARKVVRCGNRLDPDVHRRLVDAARRAMAAGCAQTTQAAPRIDDASTTMAVTWLGETRSCSVARSGGSYVAFEKERTLAVAQLCRP
jgi:hypothetical protein